LENIIKKELKTYTPAKLTKNQIVEAITSDPTKTNIDWGNEWGVSRERVRQLRVRFGIPSVKSFNHETFSKALINIENGYVLLTSNLFTDIPNFGLKKLKNWMEQDPNIKRLVEEALRRAHQRAYNPNKKLCTICEKVKPISEFYRSKTGRDRRMTKCNSCNIKTVKEYYEKRYTPVPTVKFKACTMYKDQGLLPAEFFHKSKKTTSGLQYTCKQYGKAYSRYKNMYQKAMQIENPVQRESEIRFLGNWKRTAYLEGLEQLKKDLFEYNSKVEDTEYFG
jgi:hypothetical protein